MNKIDPERLAAHVQALHGYELGDAGAARAATLVAAIAAAIAAVAPEPQFHEEPAGFAATLAGLAPEGE